MNNESVFDTDSRVSQPTPYNPNYITDTREPMVGPPARLISGQERPSYSLHGVIRRATNQATSHIAQEMSLIATKEMILLLHVFSTVQGSGQSVAERVGAVAALQHAGDCGGLNKMQAVAAAKERTSSRMRYCDTSPIGVSQRAWSCVSASAGLTDHLRSCDTSRQAMDFFTHVNGVQA